MKNNSQCVCVSQLLRACARARTKKVSARASTGQALERWPANALHPREGAKADTKASVSAARVSPARTSLTSARVH